MAVLGDPLGRIAGVIDQNFLGDEEDAAGRLEPLDVERAVVWRNFIRLMLARLQAVSSRNMYSEHGFEALIRPEFGQVCQRLIVVSYCTPGSPQRQAPSAMLAKHVAGRPARAGRASDR